MNKVTGRGRRAGTADTREQILDVARRRFLADGYQGVSMRSIAADAGVDVALLSYYFSSKQGLFGASMALAANPIEVVSEVLKGDRATLATRLLRGLLATWDDPVTGPSLRSMAGAAASDPNLNRLVREVISRELVARVAEALDGEDAPQRAAAFSAQMAGLVFSRYVLRLEPIASMSADEVVRYLGPAAELALRGAANPA